jgi:hypothetical protein
MLTESAASAVTWNLLPTIESSDPSALSFLIQYRVAG